MLRVNDVFEQVKRKGMDGRLVFQKDKGLVFSLYYGRNWVVVETFAEKLARSIVSRFKIVCNMSIAHTTVQIGRAKIKFEGTPAEFNCIVVPVDGAAPATCFIHPIESAVKSA